MISCSNYPKNVATDDATQGLLVSSGCLLWSNLFALHVLQSLPHNFENNACYAAGIKAVILAEDLEDSCCAIGMIKIILTLVLENVSSCKQYLENSSCSCNI